MKSHSCDNDQFAWRRHVPPLGFPKANRLLVQHLFIWTLLTCLGHTTVWKSQEGIAKLGQGEDLTMHFSSILPLVGLIPHKWQMD